MARQVVHVHPNVAVVPRTSGHSTPSHMFLRSEISLIKQGLRAVPDTTASGGTLTCTSEKAAGGYSPIGMTLGRADRGGEGVELSQTSSSSSPRLLVALPAPSIGQARLQRLQRFDNYRQRYRDNEDNQNRKATLIGSFIVSPEGSECREPGSDNRCTH
ncbi:unnamed protein product [Nezara viridula]|uniref:Uncharacterized protein n=1 Tax=Nezara viridula TaxID=85310 RepID=A0A9P0E941_NEZVI|nr:unnamed protein product [Nezara viridula]